MRLLGTIAAILLFSAPAFCASARRVSLDLDRADISAINGNFFEINNELANCVHKTSTETIRGYKYFTNNTYLATGGGRVGIGTTAPKEILDVAGGTGTGGILIRGSVMEFNNINGLDAVMVDNDGTNARITSPTGDGIAFYPAKTQQVTIDASGNVGIGTTTPQSSLHVPDGKYAQFQDNNAGAPTAGDCDDDAERGRLSIDTSNNRLYICNGASRAWDYIALTD